MGHPEPAEADGNEGTVTVISSKTQLGIQRRKYTDDCPLGNAFEPLQYGCDERHLRQGLRGTAASLASPVSLAFPQ